MRKTTFRVTFDVDTHGIHALKAFFEIQYLLRESGDEILTGRVDFTKKGYHIIVWVKTTRPENVARLRVIFDDLSRVALDEGRPDWQRATLWTRKGNYRVYKAVNVILGSGWSLA